MKLLLLQEHKSFLGYIHNIDIDKNGIFCDFYSNLDLTNYFLSCGFFNLKYYIKNNIKYIEDFNILEVSIVKKSVQYNTNIQVF